MQGEVQFDRDLLRFLSMAIEIWPSFQTGCKHLHLVEHAPEDSYLPQRAYSVMNEQQFQKVITNDLFEFIMSHDVREADLYDYLADILDLLMIDQQLTGGSNNPASIEFMARYAFAVITELQQGKNDKVKSFEQDVYMNVKQFKGEIVKDQNNSDEEDEEYAQDEDDEGEDEEEQQVQKEAIPVKSEQEMQREKQLQDDGWTIVKKK